MNKFDGVANTLFVPLVARINISKKFPEYFMDEKALELEKYLPQGRYTDAVDDVLCKVLTAKKKKVKI